MGLGNPAEPRFLCEGERMTELSTPAAHVLHVGAGSTTLPHWMRYGRETRLDINPAFGTDIVADMADIPEYVGTDVGPFDVVYAAHCLEHVAAHRTQACLEGWRRVLKPGGIVLIFVPDLGGLEPTDDVVYISDAGPITARDMFYGHKDAIAAGCVYMQHLTGFTQASLRKELEQAGFVDVTVHCTGHTVIPYNLVATGRAP